MRRRIAAVAAGAATVSALLILGLVVPLAANADLPPVPAPTPDPSVTAAVGPGGDEGVGMTIVNWGKPVSILDAKNKAWAHLSANAAPVDVTVEVRPRDGAPTGYDITFSTPDAFEGPAVQYCSDHSRQRRDLISCTFEVPISGGANRIDVEYGSDIGDLEAHGIVYGGDLRVVAKVQVLDKSGQWIDMPDGGGYYTPGERTTGIRYLLVNSGAIPFRIIHGCTAKSIGPKSSVSCLLRGPRPMFALAGQYRALIELDDPAAGVAVFTLRGVLGVPGTLHGPFG